MDNSSKIKILLKEYDKLNITIANTISNFKQQINHFNYYITILGAIGFYLFSSDKSSFEKNIAEFQHIYVAVLYASILICFYFLANLLDTLHHMYLSETRVHTIERLINFKKRKTC